MSIRNILEIPLSDNLLWFVPSLTTERHADCGLEKENANSGNNRLLTLILLIKAAVTELSVPHTPGTVQTTFHTVLVHLHQHQVRQTFYLFF